MELDRSQVVTIAKFENDLWPDGSGAKAVDVLAKLVYKHDDGTNVRVDYGIWMKTGGPHETFVVGDTRELILFIEKSNQDVWVYEDERDDLSGPDNAQLSGWLRVAGKLKNLALVEVTLTETRSQYKYIFRFDVTRDQDGFSLSLTSPG